MYIYVRTTIQISQDVLYTGTRLVVGHRLIRFYTYARRGVINIVMYACPYVF